MRSPSFLSLTVLIGIASGCSDQLSTSNSDALQRGMWGSNNASLAVNDSSATLQLLNGNCYGAYGQIDARITSVHFDLAGTYTQLMGVYPGRMQYAAEYSGTVAGNQMFLTISVPALQTTFGPYNLTYGVNSAWSACLYP
jgi:hypothetical protein